MQVTAQQEGMDQAALSLFSAKQNEGTVVSGAVSSVCLLS